MAKLSIKEFKNIHANQDIWLLGKGALTLLDNWKICDSVITVSPITHRPEWMGCISDDMFFIPYTTTWGTTVRLVASQSLPKLYAQNGCVYAFKRDLIMNECTIISSTTKVVIIDEKGSRTRP